MHKVRRRRNKSIDAGHRPGAQNAQLQQQTIGKAGKTLAESIIKMSIASMWGSVRQYECRHMAGAVGAAMAMVGGAL